MIENIFWIAFAIFFFIASFLGLISIIYFTVTKIKGLIIKQKERKNGHGDGGSDK